HLQRCPQSAPDQISSKDRRGDRGSGLYLWLVTMTVSNPRRVRPAGLTGHHAAALKPLQTGIRPATYQGGGTFRVLAPLATVVRPAALRGSDRHWRATASACACA